jgi:site-specific recombinase XerD
VPAIDDEITTYLEAIAVEGKTAKTLASYTNSLRDFRAAGRRLGLPEHPDDYQVPHVYAYLSDLRSRGASRDLPAPPPSRGEGLLLLAEANVPR